MPSARALPPPPVEVTRRSSTSEQVALYIRRLIFDGHLASDQRVPQDEIAAALGVSRIPVREALIALDREGWVTTSAHRGAFVNAIDSGVIADHFALYGELYGFALRRAVAHATPDLAHRLAALARDFNATDDPARLYHLAFDFHAVVVAAARSPRLVGALRAMSTFVPGNIFALAPSVAPMQGRGFVAIARAVKRGDADDAAAEYARMMRAVGAEVAASCGQRGLFGGHG